MCMSSTVGAEEERESQSDFLLNGTCRGARSEDPKIITGVNQESDAQMTETTQVPLAQAF